MTRTRVLVGSLILLLGVAFYPASMTAHHRWGKYHWARSANPLTLTVADNVDAVWAAHLTQAVSAWNGSSVLSLSTTSGSNNPLTCAPVLGRVEVCNAEYGNTGWLGVTQIWTTSGSHITQATTKANDTYFNTPQYNTTAWRRFLMCHELGHDWGLDHRNENFNNANVGSCMDYTNDPDGSQLNQLSNLSPDAHDFEQLESIYSHLDGTSGGGGGGGGRGRSGGIGLPPQAAQGLGNQPRNWGQLVSSNGRLARYVLDLGNGNLVHTFVIWA